MFPRALERAKSVVARKSSFAVRSLSLPEIGFRGLEIAEENGLWPIVFEIRFAKSPVEAYFAFLWPPGCCNDTQPLRLSFSKVYHNRMTMRAVAHVGEGLARYRIYFAESMVKEGSLLVFPIIRHVDTQLRTIGERTGARVISEAPDVRKLYHVRFVFNEKLLAVRAVIVELKSPVRAVPLTRITNTMFSRSLALAAGYHLYRFRVLFEKPIRRTSEFPPINAAWNLDDSYAWGIVTEWLVLELGANKASNVENIHDHQTTLIPYKETQFLDSRYIPDRFRPSTVCQNDACRSMKKGVTGSELTVPKELTDCEDASNEEGQFSSATSLPSNLQSAPVLETSASDRTTSFDQFPREYGIYDRTTDNGIWSLPPSSKGSSKTSLSSSDESGLRSFQSIDMLMRTGASQNGASELVHRNCWRSSTCRDALVQEDESADRLCLLPRGSIEDFHAPCSGEGPGRARPSMISSESGMGHIFRRRYASKGEQQNTSDGQLDHRNETRNKSYSTENDENLHVTESGSTEAESMTNESLQSNSSSDVSRLSFSESDVPDEGRAKGSARASVNGTYRSASPCESSGGSSSGSRRSFGRFLRRRPRRTVGLFAKRWISEQPSPSRSRSFPSLRPPLSPMTPIIGSVAPTEKHDMITSPVFIPPLRFGTNPRHQEGAKPRPSNPEAERKAFHGRSPSIYAATMKHHTEATQRYHSPCPTCGSPLSGWHEAESQMPRSPKAARDENNQDVPIVHAGVPKAPSTASSAGVPNTTASIRASCIAYVDKRQLKCNPQVIERSPGLASCNSWMNNCVTRCECSDRCFPPGFDRPWNDKKGKSDCTGWRHKVRRILRENGKVILVASLTALGMTLFDLLILRNTTSDNSDASSSHGHDESSHPHRKAWFY